MNKKLVVLAVAGAFASPLAVQAQTANVTLYGRLNLDLEFINGKQADGSNPTVNRISSNTSRFGLRGTESLGGGLNALFQVESGFDASTGNNPAAAELANRETFVGLQGSWGKVTMGKFLMPQDDLRSMFGNSTTFLSSILSDAAVWGFGGQPKGSGGFDRRTGNNIRYDSPNYSGFTGALQYETRDSSGDTTGVNGGDNGDHPSELRHANVIGGNVIYVNGPLNAAVSFERNNKVRGLGLDDTDFTIAGGYDFGTIMQGFGLRLGAAYERTKYETLTGDLRRDYWAISATVPVGGGKLFGYYGRGSNGKGGAADTEKVGDLGHGADTGVKFYEVSYAYALSPRTVLWTGYVKIANDARAAYTFHINPYTIGPGAKPGGAVFGITHLF